MSYDVRRAITYTRGSVQRSTSVIKCPRTQTVCTLRFCVRLTQQLRLQTVYAKCQVATI